MKIAIVGGGAAGMMAAAAICEESDAEVFVVEKNTILGRKVLISGGGRCNVTTGCQDLKEVLSKYPRGAKFLRTAMYAFDPKMVYDWFEDHGVDLKIEKDLRVFPVSNKGTDVVDVFEKILTSRAKILYSTAVKAINKRDDGFALELDNAETLKVDKVILGCGGQAYRHTGSTGDGYSLAESLGHSVTELAASLSSFMITESWVKELAGVSFENVRLRLVKNGKHEFSGPILLTHRGISGPAVFALSSLAAFEPISKDSPVSIFLDFFPEEIYENLHKRVSDLIASEPKKSFRNSLGKIIPRSFAAVIAAELEIEKVNAEVSKKDINKVVEFLKNCELTAHDRTPGDEFVTAGGVNLKEVDSKTMESKICPGLYFGGEILDIDGFTGGYNLQVAWCTGRLAGESACPKTT